MNYSFIKMHTQQLSDTTSPVLLYLGLRDKYPGACLLESSDYHAQDNSFSFICCQPIAQFSFSENSVYQLYPDGKERTVPIKDPAEAKELLKEFSSLFDVKKDAASDFIPCGLFGYIAFDAISSFEEIRLRQQQEIPVMQYSFFRFIIAIDHFRNQLHIVELLQQEEVSTLPEFMSAIRRQEPASFSFQASEQETSGYSDIAFLEAVGTIKEHIGRGDVFQLVLSRKFSRTYSGDDFNVYRALRSINPSPYLFYFDFGSFRIFGSSPEAQLKVKHNKAHIFPIAGTFRRTGNDAEDALAAEALKNDPKENAEHVMLVDLARNDLGKRGLQVEVCSFREIQYYSHVIHLVSEVIASLDAMTHPIDILADTFPAGTLSGAPKYKALQLIDRYEPSARGFYGGCIGFIDAQGSFNHAIMIRSFLSKDNTLHYQAGAGIVASSVPKNELEEINNKVRALRKAIELANTL